MNFVNKSAGSGHFDDAPFALSHSKNNSATLHTFMETILHILPSDFDRRRLERGDVQRDSLAGRSPVRHVVVDLLHRAHPVRKLYPD